MVQVIPKNQTIIKEIHTRDGEITINLNLTIKLEGNELSVSSDIKQEKSNFMPEIGNKESDNYYIPEFENQPILDFGKKVEE